MRPPSRVGTKAVKAGLKAPPWPRHELVDHLRIELPGYVPPRLNELLRFHHTAKTRETKRAIMLLAAAIHRSEGRLVSLRPPFAARWMLYLPRLVDWANLGGQVKLPEDALRYAGVIEDDRPTVLLDWSVSQVQVPAKDKGLMVELWHLPEGARPSVPRWAP